LNPHSSSFSSPPMTPKSICSSANIFTQLMEIVNNKLYYSTNDGFC